MDTKGLLSKAFEYHFTVIGPGPYGNKIYVKIKTVLSNFLSSVFCFFSFLVPAHLDSSCLSVCSFLSLDLSFHPVSSFLLLSWPIYSSWLFFCLNCPPPHIFTSLRISLFSPLDSCHLILPALLFHLVVLFNTSLNVFLFVLLVLFSSDLTVFSLLFISTVLFLSLLFTSLFHLNSFLSWCHLISFLLFLSMFSLFVSVLYFLFSSHLFLVLIFHLFFLFSSSAVLLSSRLFISLHFTHFYSRLHSTCHFCNFICSFLASLISLVLSLCFCLVSFHLFYSSHHFSSHLLFCSPLYHLFFAFLSLHVCSLVFSSSP